VRTGPYRFVRHPIYTGLLIHLIGACLATGNLLLVAGTLLVVLPIFYMRARTEERLLREQLGPAYDAYAREVGMLIPFVGRGAA
jgi:protein-S-isoprenylcysteine O-methyltransferase Ste14